MMRPRRALTLEERQLIEQGLLQKKSINQIAVTLNRRVTVVSREIKRHLVDGVYLAEHAHKASLQNKEAGKKKQIEKMRVMAPRKETVSSMKKKNRLLEERVSILEQKMDILVKKMRGSYAKDE